MKTQHSTLVEQMAGRLREARIAAGYKTLSAFSMKNGIPLSTYCQYEMGKRCLGAEIIVDYSRLLNIDPGWLLTGENPRIDCYSQSKNNLQPIKNGPSWVDVSLLKEIFKFLLPVLNDQSLKFEPEEILDFYFDIYNNLIQTSTDEKDRRIIIEMLVNSLLQVASKNKNNKYKVATAV